MPKSINLTTGKTLQIYPEMNQYIICCFLLTFSLTSPAHQRFLYHIGEKDYQFIVGSLNEPVVIDDKTGVELFVSLAPINDPLNFSPDTPEPIEGLERTLKVAVGNQKKIKILEFTPIHGKPGAYSALFYPTQPGIFSYRIFGSLHHIPIDLVFACNADPKAHQTEDSTVISISEGVTQKYKAGSFACPIAKNDLGIPDTSASLLELQTEIQTLKKGVLEPEVPIAKLTSQKTASETLSPGSLIALLLAGMSFVLSLACCFKIWEKK